MYNIRDAERNLANATQRYARARADAAEATRLDDKYHYFEPDPYIRRRAKEWLAICRKEFVQATAEHCDEHDSATAINADVVDLPDPASLRKSADAKDAALAAAAKQWEERQLAKTNG